MSDITDPADRLGWAGDGSGKDFVTALEKRYTAGFTPVGVTPDSGGFTPPAVTQIDNFAWRYAAVCVLVVQLLWPERYVAKPDDPFLHTSDPAREIARLIFAAAGIEPGA